MCSSVGTWAGERGVGYEVVNHGQGPVWIRQAGVPRRWTARYTGGQYLDTGTSFARGRVSWRRGARCARVCGSGTSQPGTGDGRWVAVTYRGAKNWGARAWFFFFSHAAAGAAVQVDRVVWGRLVRSTLRSSRCWRSGRVQTATSDRQVLR